MCLPHGTLPPLQVNEAEPGGCEYVANLASISQGKQERFYRAATAKAPYAVAAGCCAGEAAAFPAEHVLLERKREVVGKVGAARGASEGQPAAPGSAVGVRRGRSGQAGGQGAWLAAERGQAGGSTRRRLRHTFHSQSLKGKPMPSKCSCGHALGLLLSCAGRRLPHQRPMHPALTGAGGLSRL